MIDIIDLLFDVLTFLIEPNTLIMGFLGFVIVGFIWSRGRPRKIPVTDKINQLIVSNQKLSRDLKELKQKVKAQSLCLKGIILKDELHK